MCKFRHQTMVFIEFQQTTLRHYCIRMQNFDLKLALRLKPNLKSLLNATVVLYCHVIARQLL